MTITTMAITMTITNINDNNNSNNNNDSIILAHAGVWFRARTDKYSLDGLLVATRRVVSVADNFEIKLTDGRWCKHALMLIAQS